MTEDEIYTRVLSSLTEIEDRIPYDLFDDVTIEQLANDLSTISKEVNAVEAKFVRLIPTSFEIDIIENLCHEGKHLMAYGKENELILSITRLNELIDRCRIRNISLTIDQSEFPLSNTVAIDIIKLLMPKLEVANRKVIKKSQRNLTRIKMATMTEFAHRRVVFDVLELFPGLLSHYQISLLTALTLVGAGHLPSVEEYNIKPIIKDYPWVINRELLEGKGKEELTRKPRYLKYHEVLTNEIKEINPLQRISLHPLVANISTPSSSYLKRFKHV
jgi:hypothetical protein